MYIRPLTPKLQEKAEKELNEDSKRLTEDLQHIQEWIGKQPHLNVRRDPQFLLSFLRSSKFSLQRTKEKMDYFYTMKTLSPELFMNRDPSQKKFQEILDTEGIFLITKSTALAEVPTILLVRWEVLNPDKCNFLDLLKLGIMSLNVALNEDDNIVVNGLYVIYDMQGFPLEYAKHLTPALCKKAVLTVQHAYPLRFKGFYLINTPAVYGFVVNMFMPFFNEKLKSRVKVFKEGATEQLHKYIPHNVFPEEYGGNGGSISKLNGEFREKLEKYREWFINDDQYGSDESKRPGKPKTTAEMFGVEGSFRKLIID